MKKTTFLTIIVISTTSLVLAACGATRSAGTSSSSGSGGSSRNGAFRNQPLTPEAKLALGTIKLEGTPQAVDASLAAKLLPLWQLLAQLNSSSSTAPQEVTAVVDEIRATMNPDQVKSISSMQLTSSDIFAAFQATGAGSGSTTDPGGTAAGTRRGQGGQGGGAFFFGGGGPAGGFGGAGANRSGAGTNGAGTATSAAQSAQQASNQLSLILVNQVVQLLETRIKS